MREQLAPKIPIETQDTLKKDRNQGTTKISWRDFEEAKYNDHDIFISRFLYERHMNKKKFGMTPLFY